MAKRFLDTGFFKHPTVRGLKGPYKLLYVFIICDCDNAGIWNLDMEIARIYTDQPEMTREMFNEEFAGKFVEIGPGKLFFPSFIDHQYPKGLQNQNKAHRGVIKILKKYDLIDSELIVKASTKPLQRGSEGGKDKDKEKEKEKKGGAGGKQTKKKMTPAEHALYGTFMGIYKKSYPKISGGQPEAIIDGADERAMKDVVKFCMAQTDKDPGKAALFFSEILNNWDRLENFYSKNIRISQMPRWLPNIVKQITEHGKPKTGKARPKPIPIDLKSVK